MARFLRAAHGRAARVLGEDFSGSGALARGWVGLDPSHHAVCVDQSAEPLKRLHGVERVRAVRADVLACRARVDILACTNFPIGYWHTRRELLAYLRHARARLNPRGMLVCDLYGGRDAMSPGSYTQRLRGPDGERIEYTWEQREADPLTGRVRNAIHFRVATSDGRTRVLRDAFEYDWRLWSIPELTDAMREAGFARVDVHASLGEAMDARGRVIVEPIRDARELPDPWVIYVVARR